MKVCHFLICGVLIVAGVMFVYAESGAISDDILTVSITLQDKSVLTGTLLSFELKAQSEFDSPLNIPPAVIQSITFNEISAGNRRDRILFTNGDSLTVSIQNKQFDIVTLLGPLTIDVGVITKMVFSQKTRAGGLIYACSFESAEDIMAAAGDIPPPWATFTSGKQGQGLLVDQYDIQIASISVNAINAQAGCIEFWAKLNDHSHRFSWSYGHNPNFFMLQNRSQLYQLVINGNNGLGWSGICAKANGLLSGTRWYTQGMFNSYESLLGGDPNGWHHYALVWDEQGIEGLAGKQLAVYLDGKLNSSASREGARPKTDQDTAPLVLTLMKSIENSHHNSFVMDEFKIWDYAKTDFEFALGR